MSKEPMLPRGRYKWIPKFKTNYTNDTGHWIVVLGIDQAGFNTDTNVVSVKDQDATIVDSFLMKTFGVAADEILVGVPRHFLVPPGGSFNSTTAVNGLAMECRSLEDALLIL